MSKVIAVISAGSADQARARRAGAGKQVLLADLRQQNADAGVPDQHREQRPCNALP